MPSEETLNTFADVMNNVHLLIQGSLDIPKNSVCTFPQDLDAVASITFNTYYDHSGVHLPLGKIIVSDDTVEVITNGDENIPSKTEQLPLNSSSADNIARLFLEVLKSRHDKITGKSNLEELPEED